MEYVAAMVSVVPYSINVGVWLHLPVPLDVGSDPPAKMRTVAPAA